MARTTTHAIRVSDTDYRMNHGAKPRGRGSWAFVMHLTGGRPSEVWFAPPDLLFTEAKREALACAKERKAAWVEVGS